MVAVRKMLSSPKLSQPMNGLKDIAETRNFKVLSHLSPVFYFIYLFNVFVDFLLVK